MVATLATSLSRLALLLESGPLAQCPLCRGDYSATDLPWWADRDLGELYQVDDGGVKRRRHGAYGTGTCPACERLVDLEWEAECEWHGDRWTVISDHDTPVFAWAPAMVRRAHDQYQRARSAYMNSYRHRADVEAEAALVAYRNAEAAWRRALDAYEQGEALEVAA